MHTTPYSQIWHIWCGFAVQPWLIDGNVLSRTFNCAKVVILNDFVGIGYGLLALKSHELEVVYPGTVPPSSTGVKSVIGAGTGLGECFLTHNGRDYDVHPAEGGHADFAPRNQTEFEIMQHIIKTENEKPHLHKSERTHHL